MEITKVKIQGEGFLVNDTLSVPNAAGNRHYHQVALWVEAGGVIEPEFTPEEIAAKQAKEAYEAEMKQARLDIKAFDEVRAHFRRITKDATDENELQANLLLFKDLLALMEVGSESAIQSIMNFTAEDLAPTSLTVDDRDFLVNVYNNTRAGV